MRPGVAMRALTRGLHESVPQAVPDEPAWVESRTATAHARDRERSGMVEARSGHGWLRQPVETGGSDEAAATATTDAPGEGRPRDLTAEAVSVERAREQSAADPDARDASDIGREVAAVLEAAEASAQRIRAKAQNSCEGSA
jgi:hypothetical protein